MFRVLSVQRKLNKHQKMFNSSKIDFFNGKLKDCLKGKTEVYESVLKQMVQEDIQPNEETFKVLKDISLVMEKKQKDWKKKGAKATRRLSPETLKKILEDKNLVEKEE
jgi:hypothetical protein